MHKNFRYEAHTLEGFIQQIAVHTLRFGYWFYVTGHIPPEKDPHPIDEKLIRRYRADLGKKDRTRRKHAGYANVKYIRHERFWVLIATAGAHENFYDSERKNIRDIRRDPLRYGGYAITYKPGGYEPRTKAERARQERARRDTKRRAHVRLDDKVYRTEKARLTEMALTRTAPELASQFRNLHIEWDGRKLPVIPYAPVYHQLLNIIREVNRLRRTQGVPPVPYSSIPWRRANIKALRPLEEILSDRQSTAIPLTS